MPTLVYLGESYDCTTAIKGDDYIRLLDKNGVLLASFDGISDFTKFELKNGSYTSPTADHDCYLAVIRDDGSVVKGGHRCSDVGNHASRHKAGGADPLTPHDIGAASRRNLLGNWYFADPINQRGGLVVRPGSGYYDLSDNSLIGTTSGYVKVDSIYNFNYVKITIDGTQYWCTLANAVPGYVEAGYTIDRWKNTSIGAVLVEGDGILCTENSYLMQVLDHPIEYFLGQTFTLSVLTVDGLSYGTVTLPIEKPTVYTVFIDIAHKTGASTRFSFEEQNGVFQVDVMRSNGNNICPKARAVKLELGDTQTLAHQDADGNWVLNDPPPDPALELLKCRRYFIQERMNVSSVRIGLYDTFHVESYICNPMRVNPSVFVGEPIHISNGKVVVDIPASAIKVHTSLSPTQFVISFAVPEGMSNEDTLHVEALITLSAEL